MAMSSNKGGNAESFADLFSNVVQYSHNQEGKGYVEIRRIKKDEIKASYYSENDDDTENQDGDVAIILNRIGPLITSLIERGYRQKEIAILVTTNKLGEQVIKALIEYNSNPEEKDKIKFISEESLLISSSPAVEIIIGVLEKLTKPSFLYKKRGAENRESIEAEGTDIPKKGKYYNWNEIKVDFTVYSSSHPEMTPLERIMTFLNEPEMQESLPPLMAGLPTPTLASIVESAIKTFIEPGLRNSEALYLVSFQDLVAEYSTNHHNDPVSFLDWWYKKGVRMSVTSPDGTDAVEIMTIHKSKGLEFKCVIVPFATNSFALQHQNKEWRWVAPFNLQVPNLPPILPVQTDDNLMGSIHENLYSEYFDQKLTDHLNTYYVAFTRARNELYIFTKESSAKKPTSLSDFIDFIVTGKLKPKDISEEQASDLLNPDDFEINPEEATVSFGRPFTPAEIAEEHEKELKKENQKSPVSHHILKEYYINNRRPRLKSKASKMNPDD